MIPNADLGNCRAKLGIYHFFKTVNVFTVSLSGGLFAVFRLKVFFLCIRRNLVSADLHFEFLFSVFNFMCICK